MGTKIQRLFLNEKEQIKILWFTFSKINILIICIHCVCVCVIGKTTKIDQTFNSIWKNTMQSIGLVLFYCHNGHSYA